MEARRFWPVLVLVVVLVAGCQTLSRGRSQWVPATSRPAGVRVFVDGQLLGKTPIDLKLSRRDHHVIRFELEGYRPIEIRMSIKRPSLGETVLTSLPWAPIGGVVIGLPIFLVWNAADRPGGEWYGMGQAAVSAGIGFIAGWALGTVIDLRGPSNYDLTPRTLIVELEPAGGRAAPRVIETDIEEFRKIDWIRIKPRAPGEAALGRSGPASR